MYHPIQFGDVFFYFFLLFFIIVMSCVFNARNGLKSIFFSHVNWELQEKVVLNLC